MTMLELQVDKEGFLKKIEEWTPDIAVQIAKNEGITLTEAHWEILNLLQNFYQTYELSPAMRPLIKLIKTELGKEKANSIYLMTLFPQVRQTSQQKSLAYLNLTTACNQLVTSIL